MRLSITPITNFANINQFQYTPIWKIRQGDVVTLYFQLIDLDQQPYQDSNTYSIQGLRYIPTSSPAIVLTFPSPNTNTLKTASQNTTDGSIWTVPILASDLIYTGNVQVQVTTNGNVYNFNVDQLIQVEQLNVGAC
jgi:hypothetical protein